MKKSAADVKNNVPLRKRIVEEIPLTIPGFESVGRLHPIVQYAVEKRSTIEWFEETERKLLDQIGKGYFPIYRFCDGECYFCLGYRMPPVPAGRSAIWHYMRTFLSVYVKYRAHVTFWAGQPGYGHERYGRKAWPVLRKQYAAQLREIAKRGMVAANFCRHQTEQWMLDRYIPDIYDWLDAQQIYLVGNNYMPFYFIYALLLGPSRHRFLRGRRILVVTSLTEEKESRLRHFFEEAGVACVNFISISRSSSMTEKIELRPEFEGTELVLIGAGVGTVNILPQVEALGTLAIDVGFVLECYQDPSNKGMRVYTLPDEEMQTL